MTTYNTGNPIGSTDARDRSDNSENMDILENSVTLNEHPDRLGVMRKTRKGMELEHNNQISAHEVEHNNQMQSLKNDFDSRLAGMAFTRVGTFTTGATLTDMRQTLLWEVSQGGDGREYGWVGSFLPAGKLVAAGSSPTPVSAGNWVDRTEDRLRGELVSSVLELRYGARFALRDFVSPLDFSAPTFTEKMQLAVDLVGSIGGGVVYIPNGKYTGVGKITITTPSTSVIGSSRSGVVLEAAQGVDYIFHHLAPNPGTSYINRYLTGCDISRLTLSGNPLDDHITDGIFCQGVYKCHYHDLAFIRLNRACLQSGVKDCNFYNWHDGDREPSGVNKVNKIIEDHTPINEYWNDNNFYNIHMHAKVAHFDFSDDAVPKDGCNIFDNVLFVNNTALDYHLKLVRGLYSTITNNKFFESRGDGVILDSCSQLTFSGNLVAIPGQSRQSVGIKVVNSREIAGYGRNIIISNNIINRSSGDSIEFSGIDGFSCTGNRSQWAGDQSHFSGQVWGSASHIRVKSGARNGIIANNPCGETDIDDPSAYSRATYEVILESGTSNNIVDNQTPYYVQDNGVNNDVRCADWKTNDGSTVFDESARNLIRNHTRDLTTWTAGNTASANPTVAYQSASPTPTGRTMGLSTLTFPDTTGGWSYFRASVGTTSMGSLGATPVAGDMFIFSIRLKSNSGAMRKVTLSVGNNADTWRIDKVFNVGTTWKRYWMIAPWSGATTSLFLAYVGMQNTFTGVIVAEGAKVELIQNTSYIRRQTPSPYDFLQIRYNNQPSSTNGGDVQVGDKFYKNTPVVGATAGYVVTGEGANSPVFTAMQNI